LEQELGYKESDPMGGHDPYSNSKGCSELVTASYRNSFFYAHAEFILILKSYYKLGMIVLPYISIYAAHI